MEVQPLTVNLHQLPTAWACAEGMHFGPLVRSQTDQGSAEDMGFKPELRKAAEESFKNRKEKVDYEFVDYKGTLMSCVSDSPS